MAKAKKEVVKLIPTRVELVQNKVDFREIGSDVFFSLKDLEEKYPYLKHFDFDEETFKEDGNEFIGIRLSDLQIE